MVIWVKGLVVSGRLVKSRQDRVVDKLLLALLFLNFGWDFLLLFKDLLDWSDMVFEFFALISCCYIADLTIVVLRWLDTGQPLLFSLIILFHARWLGDDSIDKVLSGWLRVTLCVIFIAFDNNTFMCWSGKFNWFFGCLINIDLLWLSTRSFWRLILISRFSSLFFLYLRSLSTFVSI